MSCAQERPYTWLVSSKLLLGSDVIFAQDLIRFDQNSSLIRFDQIEEPSMKGPNYSWISSLSLSPPFLSLSPLSFPNYLGKRSAAAQVSILIIEVDELLQA